MKETDLLTQRHVMASQNNLGVYFVLVIVPFMQADAAVAGEAAAIWLPAVAIFALLGYVAIEKLRAR